MNDHIQKSAASIAHSATNVEEAADIVQDAVTRVENNVTHGIQPDINELKIYLNEINAVADIRQKRLLWAVWVLIALNLTTLITIILTS